MSTLLKSLFLLLLFFVDISLIGTIGFSFLQLVLCYAIVTFLYQEHYHWFYSAFLLLGFESFFAFDRFGLTYVYLVPLFLILRMATHYLASREITTLITLILALGCQTLFLAYFKLDSDAVGRYTLYQIGANLLVLFVSLKWFSTVEQGNRF